MFISPVIGFICCVSCFSVGRYLRLLPVEVHTVALAREILPLTQPSRPNSHLSECSSAKFPNRSELCGFITETNRAICLNKHWALHHNDGRPVAHFLHPTCPLWFYWFEATFQKPDRLPIKTAEVVKARHVWDHPVKPHAGFQLFATTFYSLQPSFSVPLLFRQLVL